MAFIESFSITGLAGHKKPIRRVLDRNVNIFWGLNGSGKTSLLKLLHAALRNNVDSVTDLPFSSAEVTFWSTDHNIRIRRTIRKEDIASPVTPDEIEDAGPQLEPAGEGLWREVFVSSMSRTTSWKSELLSEPTPDNLKAGRRPASRERADAPYRHNFLPISRLTQLSPRTATAGRNRAFTDATLDEDFSYQVTARWQVYNSEALGKIRLIQQQGLANILALLFGGGSGKLAATLASVPHDEAYELVRSFLREQSIYLSVNRKEFTRRYIDSPELQQVVTRIQEVTDEVQFALRPQQQLQEVVSEFYSGGKQLVLDSTRGPRSNLRIERMGEPISLKSLSSGEKQLLRLLLEVLTAESSTVMIDEPELSMHVDWQQRLVDSMRSIEVFSPAL